MITRTSVILLTVISLIAILYTCYPFNQANDENAPLIKNEYKSNKNSNFRHILGSDDDDEDEGEEGKHPKEHKESQLATVQIIKDTSKKDNSKTKKPFPEELEAEHEVFKIVGISDLNEVRKQNLIHIEGKHHHSKHAYQRQVTFAVCCIGSLTSMENIGQDLKIVFESASVPSLQRATSSCADLCVLQKNASSSPNGTTVCDVTSTFRTEDIHLKFENRGPSLIVTYTLFGNKCFLDAFVGELRLNKHKLEIGLMTTIDSYVADADSSLVVKWLNADLDAALNEDDITDDTRILSMSMQELQGLMDIKLTIAEKLLRASKLEKRESLRAKVLIEERNALDLIIRAAQGQSEGISENSLVLVKTVGALKSDAQVIKDKMSALDGMQRELEDIIADDQYQIEIYSRTYHKNEQMVHEFDERLSLLHRRRIKVIGKIKKLVIELQKQMVKIQHFIGYLGEKKEFALVGQDRLNEKLFAKKDNFTFLCNDTEINLICDQRTIFCKTKLDFFNQSGVTAEIKVNITRPKVIQSDYEIVVMANKECQQPLLRRDVSIKPVTVRKCKAEEKGCQLKALGLKKIFGDRKMKSMENLCIFVKCNAMEIDRFDIDTTITVKLKKTKGDDDSGSADADDQGLKVKVIKGKVPKDEKDGGDKHDGGSKKELERRREDDKDDQESEEDVKSEDDKDEDKSDKHENEDAEDNDGSTADIHYWEADEEKNSKESGSRNLETRSAMITAMVFTIGALIISMLLFLK